MTQEESKAITSASKGNLPREWQMDPTPHTFVQTFGSESDVGKEIDKLLKVYEEKCAIAKLRFYVDLAELLKGKIKY